MQNFIIQHWQEIVGAAFGFLYLYFEYKADIRMWVVGFVTSSFYIYVFVNAQFYAYAGISVYYLFADTYGWYSWRKRKDEAFVISHIPRKLIAPVTAVTLVLAGVIYVILEKIGDSPVALGDSIITALSIIAIWGLTKKYVEQWLLLIVANVISVVLFAQQELYPTTVLYAAFAVGSVLGYIKWLYLIRNPSPQEEGEESTNLKSSTVATPLSCEERSGERCCVLANGSFPTNAIPLKILQNAGYIVCCDGAADKLLQNTDKIPDAIVGDCDSISAGNKARFADRIYCITEQETNDMTKAVHFCIEKGCKDIVILGATGKREDHTLGNISLLSEYIDIEEINVSMVSDYGIFTAIKKTTVFESYKGQQISVFNIGHVPATFHNLKYPVENLVLKNWWQGTLNEALAENFTIETQGKMIVFQGY